MARILSVGNRLYHEPIQVGRNVKIDINFVAFLLFSFLPFFVMAILIISGI